MIQFNREEARSARDWLKNTPIPKAATEKTQASDFIVFSIKGAALVKTCKKFRDFENEGKSTPENLDFDARLARALDSGLTRKQFLDADLEQAKWERKKQNRITPKIVKAAADFSVLRDMKKIQDGKKTKRCEDLKLFDFNGTDFKEVRSIDTETGELLTFKVKGKGKKRKFILQSSLSKLDDRLSMQRVMAKLFPEYRVSKCGCVVQSKSKGVSVFKSKKHSTISCSNLQTCSSVWLDPVCASKITEKRRVEVKQAIEKHQANCGSISLVTRTVPHTKNDSLLSLRNRFRDADKFMKKEYQYEKMRSRFNVDGDIKVFELTVTWLNGWHLHIHEVYFHDADAFEGEALESNPAYVSFLKDFEQTYYDVWRDSATKAGFDEPSRKHGLQVQNGDFAAEYIAKWGKEPESKWGLDAEMTKQHIKSSKKGYTPWELIRFYRDTGDERLVPIIQEYGHSMFGQRQLMWSKGLKKKFGIGEKSDEELVDELDDVAEELGVLSPVQWKFIVKNDLRAEFFYFAVQGWDVATDFLHSFDKYPRIFSLGDPPKNS